MTYQSPGQVAFNLVNAYDDVSDYWDHLSQETKDRWEFIAYQTSVKFAADRMKNERVKQREELMKSNPPAIDDVFGANLYFAWGWKGCGFGQLSVHYDKETGRLSCMNEAMNREAVRKLLHAFADHLADNCELDD